MESYAQTNIQLFDQLQREGYTEDELNVVRDTYVLSARLFTGLYRPSGKTFVAHAVGTASILGSLRTPTTMVAAGLIHAAYEHGDFGDGSQGISETKREQIKQAVGKEVEGYVARYTALRWHSKTIPTIYDGLPTLGPIDRDILLMRLANTLEDLLDLGVLYCFNAESRRRTYLRRGSMMIDIAERLGFPTLGRELARVLEETASSKVAAELRSHHKGVVLIPPSSYCRRTRVLLCQESTRVFKRLRSMTKVRTRFRKIVHRIRQESM